MYEIMVCITILIIWAIMIAEIVYHGRKIYILWLNDDDPFEYIIPYDPALKTCRWRDGADWCMAIFMRVILGAVGSFIIALAWPVTLAIIVFLCVANYHKYMYKLKQSCGGR